MIGEAPIEPVQRVDEEVDQGDLLVRRPVVASHGAVARPPHEASSFCRIDERLDGLGQHRDAVPRDRLGASSVRIALFAMRNGDDGEPGHAVAERLEEIGLERLGDERLVRNGAVTRAPSGVGPGQARITFLLALSRPAPVKGAAC